MRIRKALPDLFLKTYPVLDPDTEMLAALSLLSFHEIDALPLAFDSEKKRRAVTGFSSLARLMRLDRKGLVKFLAQPCRDAAVPLAVVGAEKSLSVLLDTFARTRFGFARVEDGRNAGAMAGLWDVLGLFETGDVEMELCVEDVASPIYSTPGSTSVRDALKAMFDKEIRRVFIARTRRFVWDRGIIERIFSPAALSAVMEGRSKDILGGPISGFENAAAKEVTEGASLRDAARMLRGARGHCLVCDGGVVTSWDVVMKPWKASALKIR